MNTATSNITPVTELPFVTDGVPGKRLPSRSFWHVSNTGDYEADCATGASYAQQAVAYARKNKKASIINLVILDMPTGNVAHGMEIGFLSELAKLIIAGPRLEDIEC